MNFMSKTVARLARSFQPDKYELTLEPDAEKLTFLGSVTITGKKIGRPSQRLTFHQNGLKITSATVVKHDKKGEQSVELARINHHKSSQEVRLHASQMMYPGAYTVTMEFEGVVTRGMTGIYPCFYQHEGQEKRLIATQFESHYARQAFPCIDEPEAKATFDLTLVTEPGVTVLANTPAQSASGVKGLASSKKQKTVFETTPRMSTYLLAFVFGEMHRKSAKTKSGTEVSVWATPAQPADSLDFALDVAKNVIDYFEDYFGVAYPLAKCDHVALPDFSNGAMENWGLITYRERVLLAYPGETSQSVREAIATVVAHETSHQWFGNLVTMKWWNDLWLNESFANMMEYQAVDALFPDWHIWDNFASMEGLSALRRDAVPGVQAVKSDVRHPDEINTLFDPSIVYAKGGRLLYMLKNYLGEDAFRGGLKAYFTKHAYGTTEGADLWAALGEASGKDVASFMNPWLEQSGFPLVSITQNGKDVKLEQEHFLEDPSQADASRQWTIPLFASASELETLDKKSLETTLTASETMLLNTGARGHYLVRYTSDAQKKAATDMVAAQKLGASDRLMLLNGGSMLARAGYEPYGNILAMLEAYQNETSEPVWDMMALILGETRRFIDLDETLEPKIKALVLKLIAKEYQRLGWEEKASEPAEDQKLRALVISLGAYAEQPDILDTANQLFKTYQKDSASVPAELRGIAFSVPIREGDANALDYLLKLHDETASSDLKADITAAACATESPKGAEQLLERIKHPQLVKPQDADRWLVYLLRNRHTKQVAWQWMEDNWDWLEETYSEDKSYDNLPRYAASVANTPAWAKKYQAFFDPKQDQLVLARNIQIGKAEIAARVAWLQRDLASVQRYFQS
jgi:aminopeptidase N